MLNIYGIIILIALFGNYILDLVLNALNLNSLFRELPKEFEGVYNAKDHKKSQQYTKIKTKFDLIVSAVDLVILLGFWFLGGFNYLDIVVRSLGLNSVVTGIFYIGILTVVFKAINIPFDIYSTFVIEEKFGFNQTTVKTFITDILKTFLVLVVLGAPILAAVLWFFEYTGMLAWLYIWIVAVIYILFIQFIFPTLIAPLFFKFIPLEKGDLRSAIMDYARKVDHPLKDIYVIDGSRRSAKINAFFMGFGKNKRIGLFDTLIGKYKTSEIVSILAHEIGHYKKKHIPLNIVTSIIQVGILFYLLSIFLSHKGLFDAFMMQNISIYAGMVFFIGLYIPIQLVLSVINNILSRKHEYEADAYAKETTNDKDMVEALKKLSLDNLSNLYPHPLYVFLKHSHPSVLKRIQALRS